MAVMSPVDSDSHQTEKASRMAYLPHPTDIPISSTSTVIDSSKQQDMMIAEEITAKAGTQVTQLHFKPRLSTEAYISARTGILRVSLKYRL